VVWFKRQSQVVEPATAPDPLAWARTTRCPKCDRPGYLDRIDLVDSTTSQHCPDCWHRWETRQAASPTHRST
jgi:hypothetical protein